MSSADTAIRKHKHSCLDQWDALHAMLLHETMELHESQDDKEQWKLGSRIKGLHWPLLLKVGFPTISV